MFGLLFSYRSETEEVNVMNVRCAQDHIEQITNVCNEINTFDANHRELSTETEFFCDVIAFLCDYGKVLENGIGRVELNI